MLAYSIEWLVCDGDATPIGTIDASGGSVTWDGRATIQRVARGVEFDPVGWRDVNPLTDWLMPTFRTDDGTRTPLGLFTVAGLPERYLASTVTSPPEPYLTDGGLLLDSAAPLNLSGRTGEQLSQVLERICDAAGITRRSIAPAGDLLSEPVAYPVGTKFVQALAGFSTLAGFLPPFFDRDGVLTFRPPDTGDVAPDVTYDGDTIVVESRVEDSDLFTAPNVWIVVGAGGTNAPITVVAEVASDAPNSVANRGGRRIVEVLREQGVDSIAQAQRLASARAELSRTSFRTIEFAGAPNPVHDCYTTVSVYGQRMFETSWSLPLTVGSTMRHSVVSRLELR